MNMRAKALLNNPGNFLKRRAIIDVIFSNKFRKINQNKNRILDVGAGIGDVAFEVLQRIVSDIYISIDIDNNTIKGAKITLQSCQKCEFVQADAQKLPFRSEIFDMVICSEVLEHLPYDLIALREIKQVSKKDGIIIITVPYLEKFLKPGHLRRYDLYSFMKLCSNAQLKIEDIRFCCISIQYIRNILRKIYKREGMGKCETLLYSQISPIISFFILIFQLIDDMLVQLLKNLKFLNESTLVACLHKKINE